MEQTNEEKRRRRWSRKETMGFLRCYLARKAEFGHPKKKRIAYANVLEDMVSLGFTDSELTPLCLENKMRTLLQAYKAARDNNNSTGASPCFAPYMDLMDEIFGNTPIIKNDHTVCVGRRPFEMVSVDVLSPTTSPSTVSLPSPSTMELSASPQSPAASAPSCSNFNSSASSGCKKRTAREVYYEQKIQLKKAEAEEKKKARSEAVQQFKDMLKEKWESEVELEKRKVALLEKLVNKN